MQINNLLHKFVDSLKLNRRTIYRRDERPYLTRHYIFRRTREWMPSIYLHHFHASDEDQELHNHPWKRSISLILYGSYREEYRIGNEVKIRILKPWHFNYIVANKFHRVDLLTDEVWTLFLSLSKEQEWGFWNRRTKEFYNWNVHEAIKRAVGIGTHMRNG